MKTQYFSPKLGSVLQYLQKFLNVLGKNIIDVPYLPELRSGYLNIADSLIP